MRHTKVFVKIINANKKRVFFRNLGKKTWNKLKKLDLLFD